MDRYQSLIERISRASGASAQEIEGKVEAKREKLSGLISKEGAAQIIAAEMGISFEDAEVKISELLSGMKKVNVVGKVMTLYPVRSYEKNGRSGKVANFFIADETGSVRVVLWDVNHIKLIEEGKIKQGSVIQIKNASMRDSEVHLSGFSEIELSDQKMGEVINKPASKELSLEEASQGQTIIVRGAVVQIFSPRFYFVCPECSKKAHSEEDIHTCAAHGKIIPKRKAILNFVIDDGTDNMRVVVFSDQINTIVPEEELMDEKKAEEFKNDFLGIEVVVTGPVKKNQLFENLEIVANSIEKVNVEKLIEELEA